MDNEHEAGMPRWSARVDDSVRPQRTRPSGDVLVFTRDFFPNVPFRIVAQLPAIITVTILDEPPDGTQVISQPDEYNGYVITYDFHRTPIFVFLFSRRYLPTSDRYRFGDDATYFSSNLDLLEVSVGVD
ncbi:MULTISPECIES: hypothetical protein [unclassified Haladaptatus]|uniref:hypothetical protein n=1 Tax=unclassified Haladaptatus TaxID=2622732 RepID=UPI00209C1D7E|nr:MULTISPECIES: hypothetical protein [unclassified Haladaptatus]MCO8242693.1 hypothetical protein [Haladaptatus sp. AB643]MCO8252452.1 hypothetical protein [Haladaptatus sp. AB618]